MSDTDHPPLTDLIGIAPDLTGGLSTEEFLRAQRCGKCDETLTELDEWKRRHEVDLEQAAGHLTARDVEIERLSRRLETAEAVLGRLHELIDTYERQRRFFMTTNDLRGVLAEAPQVPTVASVLASDMSKERERLSNDLEAARAELKNARTIIANKDAALDASAETRRIAQQIVTAALGDGSARIVSAVPADTADCGCPVVTRTAHITRHTRECYMTSGAAILAATLEDDDVPADTADEPDWVTVLDDAMAASGVQLVFDPRNWTAPHTVRGPKATDPDREHPAHVGHTCDEYDAALDTVPGADEQTTCAAALHAAYDAVGATHTGPTQYAAPGGIAADETTDGAR